VNGIETEVTNNLANTSRALREIEKFAGRFSPWVDALCVNQNDNVERRYP
jgi:hypothetical protein